MAAVGMPMRFRSPKPFSSAHQAAVIKDSGKSGNAIMTTTVSAAFVVLRAAAALASAGTR